MPTTLRLAVVGADEPLGEAFTTALQECDAPLRSVVPVTLGEAEGCASHLDGQPPLQTPETVDWDGIDLVVITAHGAAAARLAGQLLDQGKAVVALAGVVGTHAGRLHEVPDGPATALWRVLGPLAAHAGLASVNGLVGIPVSVRGRTGIDELVNQTRGLFAMQPAEPEAFPVQIAFNLLPQVGAIGGDGSSAQESALGRALHAALGERLAVQITAVWLPTFYGAVADLHVQTDRPVSAPDIRDWLGKVPGLTVMDDPLPGGAPTPATDAVDSTDVFVGRIRVAEGDATRISLWLTYDAPRLEAAQLLEGVEKTFESVLN